jgi:DNA-binding MarR family transcriptional regulator
MLADGPICACAVPLSYREPPLAPSRTIDEAARYDGPELEDREMAVLAALRAEERTAFQGLRRKLGLHQQALTRTLRRLERNGAVERDERGYALTTQGKAALQGIVPVARRADLLPVLQALLPPSVTADDVAQRLARRWFRDLRWYGRADAPGEVTLSWLTVDAGRLVRVRFRDLSRGYAAGEERGGVARGMAILEVELGSGETLDRFPAAQAVLKALAELYAPGAVAA